MKNNIEEFTSIITSVKEELKAKEKALMETNTFNTHTPGKINNIEKRIFALELDALEIEERYSDQPNVLLNFRKRASEIMKEIELLK